MSLQLTQAVANADGLTDDESKVAEQLVRVWQSRLSSNERHERYYDGKVRIKDLGISIPPDLKWVANACGWPRIAVDYLACRSQLDGFTVSDEGAQGRLASMCARNDLRSQYQSAITSTLKHGCSFLAVTKGEDGKAVVRCYPATMASALWDDVDMRVSDAMVVVDVERRGATVAPSWLSLFIGNRLIELKAEAGHWRVDSRQSFSVGRPLVHALTYRPTLERPLGTSRINDVVRDLTDDYIRASARAEIAAEFAATTQKYLLGVSEDDLPNGKWCAYIDSILTISGEDGAELPQFGQLSQPSMQPHSDYQRMLACRMGAECSIPVSALGVSNDSPTSADAIAAANEPAVIEVQAINARAGRMLADVALTALAIEDGETWAHERELHPELSARFRNPSQPSISSVSDAVLKQVQAIPSLAETDVVLERLQYTNEEIQRIKAERRRSQGMQALQSLMQRGTQLQGEREEPEPPVEEIANGDDQQGAAR